MAARAKPVSPTIITFTKEKETKGTFRYKENGPANTQVVGTLYIRKEAAEALGNPEHLSVTIEAV